jgi:tRNA threonylcarbamoyladenosine modification (KEOPS) complex  Pcc1 subunit
MRLEALFRFRTDHAGVLFRSISPEMEAEVNPRSKVECLLEAPDVLVLKVHATDVAALRASLNMSLRLISVADEMQDLITDQEIKE